MKFSQQTMSRIDQRAVDRFHRDVAQFLRCEMPSETNELTDEQLLELIEESDRRAEDVGIVSESGIAQFCCLSLACGVEFSDTPEIQSYFRDDSSPLNAEERLEILLDELDQQ